MENSTKLLFISAKKLKKYEKEMKLLAKSALTDDMDYKDISGLQYRVLQRVAPKLAAQLPDGDCAPRAFSREWDAVEVKPRKKK